MNELSFIDWIDVISLIVGLKNYEENEIQSAKTIELIQQNDVDRANERQANLLLQALSVQFEKQNQMLKEMQQALHKILEKVSNND